MCSQPGDWDLEGCLSSSIALTGLLNPMSHGPEPTVTVPTLHPHPKSWAVTASQGHWPAVESSPGGCTIFREG